MVVMVVMVVMAVTVGTVVKETDMEGIIEEEAAAVGDSTGTAATEEETGIGIERGTGIEIGIGTGIGIEIGVVGIEIGTGENAKGTRTTVRTEMCERHPVARACLTCLRGWPRHKGLLLPIPPPPTPKVKGKVSQKQTSSLCGLWET